MNSRHPELQRLLASLNDSSTISNDAQPWQMPVHGTQQSPLPSHNPSDASYPSNSSHSSLPFQESQHNGFPLRGQSVQSVSVSKQGELRSRSSTPSVQATSNASTITTWPAAVKHVARYINNDDKVTFQIKHLISQQHKHEQEWWVQREAIVARHSGRAGNQDKAAELLKSMGALAVPIARIDDTTHQKELEGFDRKVHKALCDMVKDYESQLRKMGIPFFAIKDELIIKDNETDVGGGTMSKLDKGELRELQKRMIAYLEDLFVDS